MPISPADIAALKQKIKGDIDHHKAQIVQLEAEYRATEIVEKRVQSEKTEQRLLDLEPAASKSLGRTSVSFAESVRQAVAEFKGETFTVANVEAMLKAQKVPLPPNNLRTRIAVEVKDMVRKGRVNLVSKGSGHVPHNYRLALQEAPKSEGVLIRPRTPSVHQH